MIFRIEWPIGTPIIVNKCRALVDKIQAQIGRRAPREQACVTV